jgi:hypothetical protein
MKQFIESLRRLYVAGRVTEPQVRDMFNRGRISSTEYVYITKG